MTSDKCKCPQEKISTLHRQKFPDGEMLQRQVVCLECGTRFVPEDLLREALGAIRDLSSEHFRETLTNARVARVRESFASAEAIARRIDAVLGGK